MAQLPPLLPTPPASLRDTDAVESRAAKRQRPLEPPPASWTHHREPNPPASSMRRAAMSPPPPSKDRRRARSPPSKDRRRSRSPPYRSTTQRLAELQSAKRPSADAPVDGREEVDMAGPSSLDESLVENRPSHSQYNCKHPETSSAAVEKRSDPTIRGDEQELHSQKMDGNNQSDHKVSLLGLFRGLIPSTWYSYFSSIQTSYTNSSTAPSRNARRKWMRRQVCKEAKKQIREMKKDKLLENIKKLQDCIWLLEEGADMAEIMELRSLLESTKKQYAENEAQLANERSSPSHQVLKKETHVETTPASVEKFEREEQNMYSGEAEGRSLKGCKAVSDENELAEEVNRLKSEIKTVRQDRDYQSAQAQSLMADVAKQKEVARIYGVELEDAMRRVAALEEGALLEIETIRTLQVQLASANEKLTVPSTTRD